MTPETAFAEAMKFENRANPYPFFDELRKTPVARVENGLYAVSGYREILRCSTIPGSVPTFATMPWPQPGKRGGARCRTRLEAYGQDPSMIASDPPDHDRTRRMAMRHFGPPHSPDLIPSMEAECLSIVNGLLDKAKGKTRIDVVDDFAYPLPVAVICKILGVPLADEPMFHGWIADMMDGADLGPEAVDAGAGGPAGRRGSKAGRAEAIPHRPDRAFRQGARRRHDLEDGARRRP